MATDVQIALQPQAGLDPEAALAAAAVRQARSTLAALAQQLGQSLAGKVLASTNLPAGFTQIAAGSDILTFKLSTPLPAGTTVRIEVGTGQSSGAPQVSIQPESRGPSTSLPPPNVSLRPAPPPPSPQPQPQHQRQPSPPQAALPQPATAPPSIDAPSAPRPASAPQVPASSTTVPPPNSGPSSPAPPAAPASQPTPTTAAAPSGQPQATQSPAPPLPGTSAVATPQAAPPPPPVVTSIPSPHVAAPTAVPAPATSPATPTAAPATPGAPSPQLIAQTAPTPVPAQAPATRAPAILVAAGPAPSIATPAPAIVASPQGNPPVAAPVVPPTTPSPSTSLAPLPATPVTSPPQAMLQRLTAAFAAPPPSAAGAPPVAPTPAIAAATAQAAGMQQSAAPLLDALAAQLPRLPTPVAEAAARALANRVNLDRGAPSGEALKSAVLRSGTLLAPPAKPGDPPDLRTALTQLKSALLGFLGDEVEPIVPVARRPPPPARGATPRAFVPDLPPPAGSEGKEAARSLLGQTDGALARLKLLQLTSHGNDAARPGAATPAPAEWNLELPLLLGRELAMAQIQIARDGKQQAEARERGWRLRFALKFSVLGEVGAQISLLGRRTTVALWADETLTAEMLEEMLPELAPALAEKGLELASLTVRRGAPRDEARPMGQLMDSRR